MTLTRAAPIAVLSRPALVGSQLVLKSINADAAPGKHAALQAAAGGRPDVQILDGLGK